MTEKREKMKLLIACKTKADLEQLKTKIEGLGHEVLAVTSLARVTNLLNAHNLVDGIVTECYLDGFNGTDIIAKVGYSTPACIVGSKQKIVNSLLKKFCFKNSSFLPHVGNLESQWPHIHNWVKELELLTQPIAQNA